MATYKPRRSTEQIFHDILVSALKPIIPYRLSQKSALEYNNFRKRLKILEENELIEKISREPLTSKKYYSHKTKRFFYKTTLKGFRYIELFEEMKSLLESD